MAQQTALAIINGQISQIPSTDTIRGASGGSAVLGQVVVSFSSFLSESVATVSGQTGLSSASNIVAQIYATNDDVYAQDWIPLLVRNITSTSFDVVARCNKGTFMGSVTVNWNRTG